MTMTDTQLHFDLIQINQRLINLELALENSLVDLAEDFQKNKQEIITLQDKITNLKSIISNKFKKLENKTTAMDGLDAMIGKNFPLKHEIMQEKFNLNEECSNILNSLNKLVRDLNSTDYKIQSIIINIQTLKAIRDFSMQIERDMSTRLNPGIFFENPSPDYQPLYMIEETLNKLNQSTNDIINDIN